MLSGGLGQKPLLALVYSVEFFRAQRSAMQGFTNSSQFVRLDCYGFSPEVLSPTALMARGL